MQPAEPVRPLEQPLGQPLWQRLGQLLGQPPGQPVQPTEPRRLASWDVRH